MSSTIPTYILFSKHESERQEQVNQLVQYFPSAQIVEAVFPKYEHVPFIDQIIAQSKKITGKPLLKNEVGCLMGHRKIWKQIIQTAKDDTTHYMIVESDSKIIDIEKIKTYYSLYTKQFDLFHWGAWNGNVRIKRSSLIPLETKDQIGTPMIKSVYGTYGYSINKKAAEYLLKQTQHPAYPVDFYKYYIQSTHIKMGAIRPELISTWQTTASNIAQDNPMKLIKRYLIIKIFDCRNRIQAYFC